MIFHDQAQAQFDQVFARATGGEKAFRQRAWNAYTRFGLPDRKSEAWKYTSLKDWTREEWALEAPQSGKLEAPVNLNPVELEIKDLREKWSGIFEILVVRDGVLEAGADPLRKWLSVLKFDEAMVEFEDGFLGLSASLARPGYALDLPGGFTPTKPILIVHARTQSTTWAPLTHRLSLGRDARVQLAEIYLGPAGPYFRAELTEVRLDEGARLDWVRVQQDSTEALHFADAQLHLRERAQVSLTQLNGGAKWSRSNLRVAIDGEGTEAHVNGLTFARDRQHSDQRVEIRHAKGNSVSSQLFKGVLKDHARGVLNGKIWIGRDAQKVSSSQLNHNLLLSPTAEANTKPELEIYADDVKANHGASIGRLDEDKIFYFMSRGIPRQIAQEMLAHAFVGDVLMKIESRSLREFADGCVQAWLPEFSRDMEINLAGGK